MYIKSDNLKLQEHLNGVISKMIFESEHIYDKVFVKIQQIQNTYDDKGIFINNLFLHNLINEIDYCKLTLLNDFFEGGNKKVQIQCLRKVIHSYK